MAIKELLKSIASKLPEDSGEAKALIADAIREADTILDDLSSANKESKSRKEKIRELESQLDAAKSDLDKATGSDQKAEIERLRKIESEYQGMIKASEEKVKATWQEKAKVFSADKSSKLFDKAEKIKNRFVFAEEGKELTLDQINRNLEAYSLLEETGYFATTGQQTGGAPPGTKQGDQPTTSGHALLNIMKTK